MSYNRTDLATISNLQSSVQALQRRQTMPLSAELIGQGIATRITVRDSRLVFEWQEIIRQNGSFFDFVYTDVIESGKRQLFFFRVSALYSFTITFSYIDNPPAETTVSIFDLTKGRIGSSGALASQSFVNTQTIYAQFTAYVYAGDILGFQLQNSSSSTVRVEGLGDSPILRIVALSQLYSTFKGDATVLRSQTLATIATATFTKLTLTYPAQPFIPSYEISTGSLVPIELTQYHYGSNAFGGWDSLTPTELLFPAIGTYYVTATVVFDTTTTGATARWLLVRTSTNQVIASKTVDAYATAERAISVSFLLKVAVTTLVTPYSSIHAAVYQNSGVNQNVIVTTSTANPSFFSFSSVYLGE